MKIIRISYKDIPNILSLLRVFLVVPFVINIYKIHEFEYNFNWTLITMFSIIIVSDILDGYIARKFNCITDIGAKLDIISDSFYTISSLLILAYINITPSWFVIIMILKLLEFIVTSKIISIRKNKKSVPVFDIFGKISVLIVMLLPGLFVFRCIIIDYRNIMNNIVYIVTIMFIISFINRIMDVIKIIKIKK